MNNKIIGIGVVFMIIVIGAVLVWVYLGKKEMNVLETENKKIMEEEDIMEKEDVMEKKDVMDKTEVMEKGDFMEGTEEVTKKTEESAGRYLNLKDTDISKLSGKIVLDFSASWCPICVSFKADVEDSLSDIPSDVTLILVDYDTNQDLRIKYGVLYQHTFVQINNSGEKIKLWTGGNTLEEFLSNI